MWNPLVVFTIAISITSAFRLFSFAAESPFSPRPTKFMDPEGFERQCKRLNNLRKSRDKSKHAYALSAIEKAAEGEENLMPHFIEAAKAKATLGEMCDILRGVFGEYREGSDF